MFPTKLLVLKYLYWRNFTDSSNTINFSSTVTAVWCPRNDSRWNTVSFLYLLHWIMHWGIGVHKSSCKSLLVGFQCYSMLLGGNLKWWLLHPHKHGMIYPVLHCTRYLVYNSFPLRLDDWCFYALMWVNRRTEKTILHRTRFNIKKWYHIHINRHWHFYEHLFPRGQGDCTDAGLHLHHIQLFFCNRDIDIQI